MNLLKCLGFILLSVLVVPGVVFGGVSLVMQHPVVVTVGDTFQVTVRIVGDDELNDPATICAFETLIGFDTTKLEMMAAIDDLFFTSSDMGGACIYTEIGNNCGSPTPPGQFGAMDLSFTTPVIWPYGRATATYTFKALEVGNIQFTALTLPPPDARNEVTDCDTFEAVAMNETIINGAIRVISVSSVPTLSQYGMVVFMLAMVLCAFVFMKRRRKVQQ